MSTTSNTRTDPVTGSSTTSMTSKDATAPSTTTTSTTTNTNTNTGYNNSSNIGSSRYGSSDVSATDVTDPSGVYDTSGRAGNIDLMSGRAGATRVAPGSQDNINNTNNYNNTGLPGDSTYGTTGYGYGRAAPGMTSSEYSSTMGTGAGIGTASTGRYGTNTAYTSNVNQPPLDAAVQTRPDGSLNTDSMYGSKSAAQTQMGTGAFRPGMTSGTNTTTSGDYADTADTGANVGAPYRAVPTTGPFMTAADGTGTVPGTGTGLMAPGTANIPPLGTGHTMVATDMPSSQIIGGAGAINSTTTTTVAGTGVAMGSAGRVLMVLSSATPAIYGASLMHPSTLFTGQKRKSGYFWDEVAIPYQTFTDAGYAVDFCSETGSASVDEMSLDSNRLLPQGKSIWNDKRHPIHSQLQSNILSSAQIDPSRYNIVFFAGGHAAAYDLPTATNVQRVAASVYEQGGVIAAVCHGTAVFKGLRLSNGEFLAKGRRLTGFSAKGEQKMGMMDQLRSDNVSTIPDIVSGAGGQWQEHESDPMAEYVIDDGRIVTGMNPASAGPVANKAIQIDKANSNRHTGTGIGTGTTYQTGHHPHHHHHQQHHNRAGFSSTTAGIDSGYDKTAASASQTDLPRDQTTYSNTSRIA